MFYDHETRAAHTALLEAYYLECDCDAYSSATALPIFVPTEIADKEISVEDLKATGDGYWSDCSQLQPYLQQRVRTLIERYRCGTIPTGWRLAQGVFPVINEPPYGSFRLLALLKPEGDEFRTVYCVGCSM